MRTKSASELIVSYRSRVPSMPDKNIDIYCSNETLDFLYHSSKLANKNIVSRVHAQTLGAM